MRNLLTVVVLGLATLVAAVPAQASWLSEAVRNSNTSIFIGPPGYGAYPGYYAPPVIVSQPPVYIAPPYVAPVYPYGANIYQGRPNYYGNYGHHHHHRH